MPINSCTHPFLPEACTNFPAPRTSGSKFRGAVIRAAQNSCCLQHNPRWAGASLCSSQQWCIPERSQCTSTGKRTNISMALRKWGNKDIPPRGSLSGSCTLSHEAPRAQRPRKLCSLCSLLSIFFLPRGNTCQKLLSKPWCCPCLVLLFSWSRQSGHIIMAPRSICPFELVLKITPFQVKHIYLITLLPLLWKSFFLRRNRKKKKKGAFGFLEVAVAGNRRKTANMYKKNLSDWLFLYTLAQLTCEPWSISHFPVKKLLSKLSTFIIPDKNAIIYYMWVVKSRQLLYTEKNYGLLAETHHMPHVYILYVC